MNYDCHRNWDHVDACRNEGKRHDLTLVKCAVMKSDLAVAIFSVDGSDDFLIATAQVYKGGASLLDQRRGSRQECDLRFDVRVKLYGRPFGVDRVVELISEYLADYV